MTNIQRLHDTFDLRLNKPWKLFCGVGKTFLKVHELAAVVCLGDPIIICIMSKMDDLLYLTSMIDQVFEEYEIVSYSHLKRYEPILEANRSKIFFFTEARL